MGEQKSGKAGLTPAPSGVLTDEELELRREQKMKRVYDLLEQTPLSYEWQRIFDKSRVEGSKMAREEGGNAKFFSDAYGEGYARGYVGSRKAAILRMMLAQYDFSVLLAMGESDDETNEKLIRAMASQYRIPLDEDGEWSASPRRVLINQLQHVQQRLASIGSDADYFASQMNALLEQQKLKRKELMTVCQRMEAMLLLQCTDEEYDSGDNEEVVEYAEV